MDGRLGRVVCFVLRIECCVVWCVWFVVCVVNCVFILCVVLYVVRCVLCVVSCVVYVVRCVVCCALCVVCVVCCMLCIVLCCSHCKLKSLSGVAHVINIHWNQELTRRDTTHTFSLVNKQIGQCLVRTKTSL